MNIPKKVSSYLTNFIKNNSSIAAEDADVIEYGLNLFLSTIIKFSIVLLLALLLGITKYMLICIISFGAIRHFAGGIHSKTSFGCLISMMCIYFSVIYTSFFISLNLKFIVIAFVLGIILIILFAPADVAEKPIISIRQRRQLKFCSVLMSLIMLTAIFIIKDQQIRTIIALSYMTECLTITPIVYRITNTKRGDAYEEIN